MIEIKNRTDLKQFRHKSGIYMFLNIINDKKYIGQAIDLNARLLYHLSCIRRHLDKSVLYKAVLKYGFKNFKIYILTVFPPHNNLKKNLDLAEKIYIQFYDTYKNGYNCTLGGDGGKLGFKLTKEQIDKIKERQKGKTPICAGFNKRRIFLYNFVEKYYVDFESATEASRQLKSKYGIDICTSSIESAAKGRNKRANNFIAAYNEKSLEDRIIKYTEYLIKNKYRSIRPDYDKYFKWLLTVADNDGFIPTSAEISKILNISRSSIIEWNRVLKDKIQTVRIGQKDRKQIINYDQYKSKENV